jgi:hypothetical protein
LGVLGDGFRETDMLWKCWKRVDRACLVGGAGSDGDRYGNCVTWKDHGTGNKCARSKTKCLDEFDQRKAALIGASGIISYPSKLRGTAKTVWQYERGNRCRA